MRLVPQILAQVETGANVIFRGHGNSSWDLKPAIGRHFTGDWSKVAERETRALAEFKLRALPFARQRPTSDIEWLALMQHHGCATRLIDFTTNPLIALFFASDPAQQADGDLIRAKYTRRLDNVSDSDLFSQEQSFVYHPPHITERIIGQAGCFVYSSHPNHSLMSKQTNRLTIRNDDKPRIRSELAILGITYSSLFPGMDGICRDLNDTLVFALEFEEVFS